MFCNFCENFDNSKWPPFLGRENFFENWENYSAEISCGSKISSKLLYLVRFSRYKHFCVLQFLRKIRKYTGNCFIQPFDYNKKFSCARFVCEKIANLISKLNFYKLIPYPMDNSLSGRRRPARQTSEKDVLCLHRQAGP